LTKITTYIALSCLLLVLAAGAGTWLFLQKHYLFSIGCFLLILFIAFKIIFFYKKIDKEIAEFSEAIHYKDFTRYFNLAATPSHLKPLRQSFNNINQVFKQLSREKELHAQYLEKMLALINTGILAYNTATEEVQWMNEALKKIIQIPYIKNLKGISKRDPILYDNITTLLPGESKLIETQQQNSKTKILITATTFKTADSTQKLLVFQNINHVVEETEAKAWNSLLNVMTHEIMNSVAPISSLADTLLQNYHEQQPFNNEKDIDVITGIETIKRRSDGLLRFAQVYRNLSAIQQLKKAPISVQRILEHIDLLMRPTLNSKNIDWQISVQPIDLIVLGDNDLLEQVFINLITNAFEALKCTQEPLLHIKAEQHEDGTTIKVIDNGQGIDEEIKDKIFIPFFTTKKNGNGIGLSLCKQIMLLHKGDIQVHSVSGKGSIFTLYFNSGT